jgi:methylenetetrahydrofolate dehydrogenase (NADP+)/methenyltetrahydrofolate cyclohydrolase
MRHLTIDAYLDELSARIPAPGGGACAALHAAQAAALTAMVSRYSSGEKFAPHKAAIDRICAESDQLMRAAAELADDDAAAFGAAGKDVDGANPESLGRLAAGLPAFAPATAEAVLSLLDHAHIELRGRHAVVVGRSAVVGKPVAHLLLHRDATVTICHSRTADLARHSRDADVLVVAAGRPGMITGAQVRPGAVVIDVGTNPTADGGLVGDVEPVSTAEVAGALTPVPGGVGPVTSALLLQHTVRAAQRQLRQ